MSEDKAEYITEAMKLLNGEPSLVIEPERTVIERRGKEFKETTLPAFVKISTSFKNELIEMSDAALKVWIFIALSVNRKTGTANPGLRTIAKALGKGVNTIQDCIKELESANLLQVDRHSRKYNIYEPVGYVSANRHDPVSEPDTDEQTVSEKPETVSENVQSVSDSRILNQINQREPEKEAAAPLSQKDLSDIQEQANKTMDGFLENERKIAEREKIGQAWRGRELLPPNYLAYGDWWHGKTQQHMYGAKGKAQLNTEWLRAFKSWWENEVSIPVLEQVYEAEKDWKGVIGKPSELTTKAIALQVLPPEEEPRKLSLLEQIQFDLQKASLNAR